MDFKFHTHNIHLFAYYLSEKVDSLGDYQQHWLWDKCDELVVKTLKPRFEFSIKEHLYSEKQNQEAWAKINIHFSKTLDYHQINQSNMIIT